MQNVEIIRQNIHTHKLSKHHDRVDNPFFCSLNNKKNPGER